ncbi:hypothetical protein SD77_3731 [Bacillus badius]|uniref:Uncharacterized protein n=1 Tax=Bacillus badius TaxID=1455 RepID=A0ABR5AWG0_BACBA|nr:hypothetical protein SD77_3731 [Bacillus badius]
MENLTARRHHSDIGMVLFLIEILDRSLIMLYFFVQGKLF